MVKQKTGNVLIMEEYELWMEKSTNIIYEVQHFGEFVIARPATPALYSMIKRLTVPELLDDFEESFVDVKAFRAKTSELIIGDD